MVRFKTFRKALSFLLAILIIATYASPVFANPDGESVGELAQAIIPGVKFETTSFESGLVQTGIISLTTRSVDRESFDDVTVTVTVGPGVEVTLPPVNELSGYVSSLTGSVDNGWTIVYDIASMAAGTTNAFTITFGAKFPNIVTPDGFTADVAVTSITSGSFPGEEATSWSLLDNELPYELTLTAMAAIDWHYTGLSLSKAGQTLDSSFAGGYVTLDGGGRTFTVTAADNRYGSGYINGTLGEGTLTLVAKLTLPAGVSLTADDIDAGGGVFDPDSMTVTWEIASGGQAKTVSRSFTVKGFTWTGDFKDENKSEATITCATASGGAVAFDGTECAIGGNYSAGFTVTKPAKTVTPPVTPENPFSKFNKARGGYIKNGGDTSSPRDFMTNNGQLVPDVKDPNHIWFDLVVPDFDGTSLKDLTKFEITDMNYSTDEMYAVEIDTGDIRDGDNNAIVPSSYTFNGNVTKYSLADANAYLAANKGHVAYLTLTYTLASNAAFPAFTVTAPPSVKFESNPGYKLPSGTDTVTFVNYAMITAVYDVDKTFDSGWKGATVKYFDYPAGSMSGAKKSDKTSLKPGDTVTHTIEIQNGNATAVANIFVKDILDAFPAGMKGFNDSAFRVSVVVYEPDGKGGHKPVDNPAIKPAAKFATVTPGVYTVLTSGTATLTANEKTLFGWTGSSNADSEFGIYFEGSLPPGQKIVISYTLTVPGTISGDVWTISNRAAFSMYTVTGPGPGGGGGGGVWEPKPLEFKESGKTTTPVTTNLLASITKELTGAARRKNGDTVQYTIRAGLPGSTGAGAHPVIVDILDVGLKFTGSSAPETIGVYAFGSASDWSAGSLQKTLVKDKDFTVVILPGNSTSGGAMVIIFNDPLPAKQYYSFTLSALLDVNNPDAKSGTSVKNSDYFFPDYTLDGEKRVSNNAGSAPWNSKTQQATVTGNDKSAQDFIKTAFDELVKAGAIVTNPITAAFIPRVKNEASVTVMPDVSINVGITKKVASVDTVDGTGKGSATKLHTGDTVNYSVTFTNNSVGTSVTIDNFVDFMPFGQTYKNATFKTTTSGVTLKNLSVAFDAASGTLTADFDPVTVAAGGSVTVTYSAVVTSLWSELKSNTPSKNTVATFVEQPDGAGISVYEGAAHPVNSEGDAYSRGGKNLGKLGVVAECGVAYEALPIKVGIKKELGTGNNYYNNVTGQFMFSGNSIVINWVITIESSSKYPLTNYTVIDTLPPYLAYNASAAIDAKYNTGGNTAKTADFKAETITVGDRQYLIITGLDALSQSTGTISVSFSTMITKNDSITGSYTNSAYLMPGIEFNGAISGSALVSESSSPKDSLGDSIVPGAGVTADKGYSIITMYGASSYKMITNADNESTKSGYVPARRGGTLTFDFYLENTTSSSPYGNIAIIDRLPAVGDTGVIRATPRESAWAPLLTGDFRLYDKTGKDITNSATIYLGRQGPDEDLTQWWSKPASGDTAAWTELKDVKPGEFGLYTTIKVEMTPGFTLGKGDSIRLHWTMTVPDNAPLGAIAWNSAAFKVMVGSTAYYPEPVKVGAVVKSDPSKQLTLTVKKIVDTPENIDREFFFRIRSSDGSYDRVHSIKVPAGETGSLTDITLILPEGYYDVTEVANQNGGALTGEYPYEVTYSPGGTINLYRDETVTVTNNRRLFELTLTKEASGLTGGGTFYFKLYKDGTWMQNLGAGGLLSVYIQSDGSRQIARYTNLEKGTYRIEEVDSRGNPVQSSSSLTVTHSPEIKLNADNPSGELRVTNRYYYEIPDELNVTVRKTVTGTGDSTKRTFYFQLYRNGGKHGDIFSIDVIGDSTSSVVFRDVPAGNYTVREVLADGTAATRENSGFTVTVSGGVVAAPGGAVITVTNSAEPPSNSLKITKRVTGVADGETNVFYFQLYRDGEKFGDVFTITVTGNSLGSVTFDNLPAGVYSIKELLADGSEATYDSSGFIVSYSGDVTLGDTGTVEITVHNDRPEEAWEPETPLIPPPPTDGDDPDEPDEPFDERDVPLTGGFCISLFGVLGAGMLGAGAILAKKSKKD